MAEGMRGPEGAIARLELRALVDAYAVGADTKRYEDVADCFTDDGSLLLCMTPGSDEPTSVHHGRAEILGAMANLDAFVATSHVVGAQRVALDGDHGRGDTTCLALHVLERPSGRRLLTMGIRYEDEFTRADGGWLIGQRRLVLLWQELRPMEG